MKVEYHLNCGLNDDRANPDSTLHGVVFAIFISGLPARALHQRQQHDADDQHHKSSRRRGGE